MTPSGRVWAWGAAAMVAATGIGYAAIPPGASSQLQSAAMRAGLSVLPLVDGDTVPPGVRPTSSPTVGAYAGPPAVAADPVGKPVLPDGDTRAGQLHARDEPTSASLPFESEVAAYLRGRLGEVTLAVRVHDGPRVMTYTSGEGLYYAASIVKVGIMAAVMDRARREGRLLSSWERSQLAPMIRWSSNSAASALWSSVGGGRAVERVMTAMGAGDVVAGPGGSWGLTQTSARDWVMVLGHFAGPSAIITESNRAYARSLMTSVDPSQDWGVTAGPTSGSVSVKNGWLPRSTGWHVNSIGISPTGSWPYEIAVQTHASSGSSQTYQQETIEGVSRIVWAHRARLIGIPGDMTGDGRSDLSGVRAGSGAMTVLPGDGTGGLGPALTGSGTWSAFSWLGSPGDVDRDGMVDLYAVERDSARLIFFRGLGRGRYGAGVDVGTGWGDVRIVPLGLFDASPSLHLLTIGPDGTMIRWRIEPGGQVTRVATMTGSLPEARNIVAVGDATGDGLSDLAGIGSDGRLRVWRSSATGWSPDATSDGDFTSVRLLAAPGDLTGNGTDDLVAVAGDGTLTRYAARPGATFGSPRVLPLSGTDLRLIW